MPDKPTAFDEHDAFLCACKSEPYTASEWAAEVWRLQNALADASERWERAERDGVCLPRRFDSEARCKKSVRANGR